MDRQVAPIVVKLGGSVVTVKDRPFTPNHANIERLATEIAEAGLPSLCIIHGGGSFGHPVAHEYDLTRGYQTPRQLMGFAKTKFAMTTLNNLVIDALIRNGVPAVPVQPSDFVKTERGRLLPPRDDPVGALLGLGVVPVLFGDAVLDRELGFTILSGDQLAAWLVLALGAPILLIGLDVDGLYTEDPKANHDATLIEEIALPDLKRRLATISGSKTTDVTGGMVGKIRELIPTVERGVVVNLINATVPRRFMNALQGGTVRGTTIRR
jgi:isopentenyl phosphate kinase